MHSKSIRRSVGAGLLYGLSLHFCPAAAAPRLDLQECGIRSGNDQITAQCGTLRVPENPFRSSAKQPSAKHIQLAIAVVPAASKGPSKAPLFVIAGGPGRGTTDLYAKLHRSFERIHATHDIVLVDQRGTGLSNRLDCHFDADADFANGDQSHIQSQAKQCLAQLSGDARYYTTSVAVRDLEAVRAALGYDAVNLYGVSYGSRVAQHYLRRYPQRVRAMVLDGAVPADVAVGPDIAIQSQRALDELFARCADDALCSKSFADIRETFVALRERVQRHPIQVELTDPISAEPTYATLGPAQLSAAVRKLSYADETASLLPLLIYRAQVEQQPQALIAQYLRIQNGQSADIAYGMHLSVACSEDAPRWNSTQTSRAELAQTYLGASFIRSLEAMCSAWPRGVVDTDFGSPLRGDLPVLVLSGENDPVTPIEYGARVAKGFRNAQHIVLKGQGHGQMANRCAQQIVSDFFAAGSTDNLNVSCAPGVTPRPFAIPTGGHGK
jgi:pimeloyl-ACP methyl ester carboxylesterase